jgi:signal transduction histidine kinase
MTGHSTRYEKNLKLLRKHRVRLAVERGLKSSRQLSGNAPVAHNLRAYVLRDKIAQQRAEMSSLRNENQRIKSDLTLAHHKTEIAERRLWQSIETIQGGFAFFDPNGSLISANRAYLSIFANCPEIKPGVQYERLLVLVTALKLIELEGGRPDDWVKMMLERWHQSEPEPIVLRFCNDTYINLIDTRGKSGDMVSLALDITASINHEQQLQEAQQRAAAANRAKSAFRANMSHEIRTPLSGVVGMSELLLDTSMTEEQQLYVSTIKHSAEALLGVVNDVLDYSKIEANKLNLYLEQFD